MPKMRNGETLISQLANWIARKCRNHNPLSELDLPVDERERLPNLYKVKKRAGSREVLLVSDPDRNCIYYHNGSVAFEITVRQVPLLEVEQTETEMVAA